MKVTNLALYLLLIFIIGACTSSNLDVDSLSPKQAKEKLEDMGFKFEEREFTRQKVFENSVAVKLYLRAGMSPNVRPPGGWLPLNLALAYGDKKIEVINDLISAGADVNAIGVTYDAPPLCVAVGGSGGDNKIESIKALIEAGAELNKDCDGYGNTPLIKAAFNGGANAVKVLIDAGADINSRNGDGKTALDRAIWSEENGTRKKTGHTKVIKILRDAGISED